MSIREGALQVSKPQPNPIDLSLLLLREQPHLKLNTKQTLLTTLTTPQTRTESISLLQKFIQAPSPNPPGNTLAAAEILTSYLTSKNIPYETLCAPTHPEKASIVSQFTGNAGPGPRVILNGHIDHFPIDPSTLSQWGNGDPYSGHINQESGRIHGRGVVDMKSGTCSLLLAYSALHSQRESLSGSVCFCAVSDEETGGKYGTKYLLDTDRKRFGGDVVLSAEPSGLIVRFSEKGTLRLKGVARTGGAHGAYLNLSTGAVRTSTTFLTRITSLIESLPPHPAPEIASYMTDRTVLTAVDRAMGRGTSSIIAKPTVNIGTIKGGVKVNMIPDSCVFELDIRLPVGLSAQDVMLVIEREIQEGRVEGGRYAGATIQIEKMDAASNPASVSSISHPVIESIMENAALPGVALTVGSGSCSGSAPASGDCGEKPAMIPSMGATDCKHYRYAGIPAYVYGCSPLTMAAVNESASIEEFLHVAQVHALAVWDYLGVAEEK